MPRWTCRFVNLPTFQSSTRAAVTASGSFTSPFSTAPSGIRTCATLASVGGFRRISAARTDVAPMSSPIRERAILSRRPIAQLPPSVGSTRTDRSDRYSSTSLSRIR